MTAARGGSRPDRARAGRRGLRVALALLAHGAAGPGAGPLSAQGREEPAAGTTVEVHLEVLSEAGGAAPETRAELSAAGRERAPLAGVRRDGATLYVFRTALPARVRVRAPGHLPDSVVLADAVGAGPVRRRLVLGLDPYVMTPIEAAVRWGPGAATSRSASSVRFADAAIPWGDVGEWLAAQPGVAERRTGPGGGQTVSVRGGRPEGVLVLLDGLPLNDALTGRADLSTVPVASLESATLVRGSGSALYGSGALAGVLLLRSRYAEGRDAQGSVTLSSFGGVAADAFLSTSGREGRAAFAVSARRSENDFRFTDRTTPGGSVRTRRNADEAGTSIALSASRGDVRLQARFDVLDRGSPGRMGTTVHDEARWREDREAASLGWSHGRAAASLRVGRTGSEWDPGTALPVSARVATDAGGAAELRLGPGGQVLLAGRIRGEALEGDEIEKPARRLSGGVAASAGMALGPVRVEPAVALDAGAGSAAVSPELGLSVEVLPGARLRARAGQAFRLPTFGDLAFATSVGVRPNPDLAPERVRFDGELGLAADRRLGGLRVAGDVAVWHRVTEDPIVWLASSVAVWSPRNLERLVSSGLEARLELGPLDPGRSGWTGFGTLTVDRSRLGFGANRNPVPYRPGLSATLGVERQSPAVSLRAALRWTGERTTSIAGTRALPGFLLVDLAVSRRLPGVGLPLELELRVDNALDESYELVELVPEPGRRISLTLRAR